MTRKTEKKYNKDNKNKVKKRGGKYNKTKRISKINNDSKSHIVRIFIEMLNAVKLYHWKTKSFAQHKATDELYSNLNEHIDTFVEILLGKDESRIRIMEKKIDLLDSSNTTEFKMRVYEYRDFLIDMTNYLDNKSDSDLLNVRDEILGDINQFLYLMTFDK